MSLLRVVSNSELDEQERRKNELSQALVDQQQPFVLGIAQYIRECYNASKWDREVIDNRMLRSLRQRLGEYEPDMLQELEAQGGNQVYMLLTQTKCRGAEAWIRDVLLSTGMVPWDMQPTPIPELDDEDTQGILNQIREQVQQLTQDPNVQLTPEDIKSAEELGVRKIKTMRNDAAKRACDGMKKKISDQLYQGSFMESIDDFLSDLCTYPFAVVKGPIITNQPVLKWMPNPQTGKYEHHVEMQLAPRFSRVSPFDFFWEPGVEHIQDGYTIERHELSRRDVVNMKGQPGYDQAAVSLVLDDYRNGMLNEWLDVQYNEFERRRLESRRAEIQGNMSPAPVFKALEFNGSVSGRLLREWGRQDITDEDAEYEVNAWLIGRHVVRAVLNTDPLSEKPYRVARFNKIPGSIPGMSLPELIADTQAVCNASARAIVNNMAIASGPQVEVNIDRLPPGEKITEVHPWKIWQMNNDPLGTTAPAVRFEQPEDNTSALMQIFEKFSRQADEQSGIPAYAYGDTDIQGAGRTASGLSMLMGSAGKGIRQIITGVDTNVIQPALRHLYRWNMKFDDDESIKGDADVIMKGTSSLVKEQVNLRRNEFLQATANELDMSILRPTGRAAVLREVAKGLEMDIEKIIPSEQELELQDKLKRAHEQAMARAEEMKAQGAGAQNQIKQQQVQMQNQQKQQQLQNQDAQKRQQMQSANEMAQQKQQMQQQMDMQRADSELEKARLKAEVDKRVADAKLEVQREIEEKKIKQQGENDLKKAALQAAVSLYTAKITAQANGAGPGQGGKPAKSEGGLELSDTAKEGITGVNEMLSDLSETSTKIHDALRDRKAGTTPAEVRDLRKLMRDQLKTTGKAKKFKVIRENGQIVGVEQESDNG